MKKNIYYVSVRECVYVCVCMCCKVPVEGKGGRELRGMEEYYNKKQLASCFTAVTAVITAVTAVIFNRFLGSSELATSFSLYWYLTTCTHTHIINIFSKVETFFKN